MNDKKKLIEDIEAYRTGNLPEKEVDNLWLELISDRDSFDYLVTVANLQKVAELVDHEDRPAEETNRGKTIIPKWYKYLVPDKIWKRTAAAILLLAAVITVMVIYLPDGRLHTDPLDKIALDHFRSSAIQGTEVETSVQFAINQSSLGNYNDAVRIIEDLLLQELTPEEQIIVAINKGSIHYNHGSFLESRNVFAGILQDMENLHLMQEEQVHWYLGNCYLQLGDKQKAIHHITETLQRNGAYKRMATRLLEGLSRSYGNQAEP